MYSRYKNSFIFEKFLAKYKELPVRYLEDRDDLEGVGGIAAPASPPSLLQHCLSMALGDVLLIVTGHTITSLSLSPLRSRSLLVGEQSNTW